MTEQEVWEKEKYGCMGIPVEYLLPKKLRKTATEAYFSISLKCTICNVDIRKCKCPDLKDRIQMLNKMNII